MRHGDGNAGGAPRRARKVASGVLAGAAVVAASLLVVDADVAPGQDFHDPVTARGSTEFVVPVLERREAMLPDLPPPAPTAPVVPPGR